MYNYDKDPRGYRELYVCKIKELLSFELFVDEMEDIRKTGMLHFPDGRTITVEKPELPTTQIICNVCHQSEPYYKYGMCERCYNIIQYLDNRNNRTEKLSIIDTIKGMINMNFKR